MLIIITLTPYIPSPNYGRGENAEFYIRLILITPSPESGREGRG